MPRRREGSIRESLEDLQRLEAQYRGKSESTRITVLRLLKQDPSLGIEDVGALVGYSKPTVKRWWRAYREGGLDALLRLNTKRSMGTDEGVSLLKQKLIAGEFSRLDDVREWLNLHRGGRSTRKVGNIIRERAGESGNRRLEQNTAEDFPLTSGRLIEFLSSLPLSSNMPEWIESFRKGLQVLLGDVDRITISLNIRCDLLNPEQYSPKLAISHSLLTGSKAINPILKEKSIADAEDAHFSRVLDNLRQRKFPFEQYHAPHSFVYFYGGHAYLGILILWREHAKPEISRRTLEALESLRGFIIFAFSDFVARHNVVRPIEHAFDVAFHGVTEEIGLTMQERRILMLQLLGLSYEEVADTLKISLNTVRYHLRSIYAKTGAHSQAELFAKYFTPGVDPQRVAQ